MMTRAGAGTPADETLRPYWLPVSFAPAEEFKDKLNEFRASLESLVQKK